MTDISTNKQIRWRQFRASAKGILQRADGAWGITDRIGELARAMEHAYAAGAANRDKPVEGEVSNGVVRWDAIPSRARAVLEEIGPSIARHANDLRAGTLVAILEGASKTGRKGDRARFAFWRPGEGGFLHRANPQQSGRDWATTSVSALLQLDMFRELETHEPDLKVAELTLLGLETVMAAVATAHIFTIDQMGKEPSGG